MLKTNIQGTTKTVIGRQKQEKSKPRITDEVLNGIDERRLFKNQQDKYNELNGRIKRKIGGAKGSWSREQRDEAEKLHQLHDSCNFHKKVKGIPGASKRTALPSIRNRQGRPIIDTDELRENWTNYAEILFRDQ